MVEPKAVTQPQKVTAIVHKPVDPKVQQAFTQLYQRTQNALIKKLMSVSDKYKIPSESELQKMNVNDLCKMAGAYNVPIPGTAHLRLISASLGLPSEVDEDWKKLSVIKGFEQANSELDKYEVKP